jgi:hypothetical protein
MLYKPNYCCHCGEKIDRQKWGITASRRFCESCASEFVGADWLPRLLIFGGIVGLVFGFGSFLPRSDKSLRLTTAQTPVSTGPEQNQKNRQLSSNTNVQISAPSANAANNGAPILKKQDLADPKALANLRLQTGEKPAGRQNSETEAVYFCGAQTKKGTPCSRRVKGGGRCWQHAGQPALLPAEKLLISQ